MDVPARRGSGEHVNWGTDPLAAQLGADSAELGVDRNAEGRHRGDRRECDQCGEKCVLDQVLAFSLGNEPTHKILHNQTPEHVEALNVFRWGAAGHR